MKKIIVLLVVFFSYATVAQASLLVTEVMYNPEVKTDHLWIKIFNNGDSDVDLSSWFVADYDGASWHYHAINRDGSPFIGANSYAVIAKASATTITAFKTKNPDISDTLFYGNLTIENEGTIGLSNDKKSVIGQISYGGGVSETVSTEDSSPVLALTKTRDSSVSTTKEKVDILKINTKIISPKTVISGIPISLTSVTTTNRGETYNVGKFVWNFGDGTILETKDVNPFSHVYDYEGEYVLNLSYFDNIFNKIPDATDRVILKVTPTGIFISSIGSYADPYVEIGNNSKYEMILSGWSISGVNKSFILPEGTVLLPGKNIKISPKITGFSYEDIKILSIKNPNGEIVANYPSLKTSTKNNSVSSLKKNNTKENDSNTIDLNDLGASASTPSVGISSLTYSIIGLIVIIGLGITSFIFVKRKKDIPDYAEKDICAKDIKIIE